MYFQVYFDRPTPMKQLFRSSPLRLSLLLSWLAVGTFSTSGWVDARDVVTPAFGYLRFDCLGASDTHLSVPFQRPDRWSGKLAASPVDQGNGTIRVSLAGSPAFSMLRTALPAASRGSMKCCVARDCCHRENASASTRSSPPDRAKNSTASFSTIPSGTTPVSSRLISIGG